MTYAECLNAAAPKLEGRRAARTAPQKRYIETAKKEADDSSKEEVARKKRRRAAGSESRRREQEDARSNRPIRPERDQHISNGLASYIGLRQRVRSIGALDVLNLD
jgi:cell division septum initiation protein DivIVA